MRPSPTLEMILCRRFSRLAASSMSETFLPSFKTVADSSAVPTVSWKSGCGGPQMKRITTPAMPRARPSLLRHAAVNLRAPAAATKAAWALCWRSAAPPPSRRSRCSPFSFLRPPRRVSELPQQRYGRVGLGSLHADPLVLRSEGPPIAKRICKYRFPVRETPLSGGCHTSGKRLAILKTRLW